jgi:hypothetical protein
VTHDGSASVIDHETDERIPLWRFKRIHGSRGEQWLCQRRDTLTLNARDGIAEALLILSESLAPGETAAAVDPEKLLDVATEIIDGPREGIEVMLAFLQEVIKR